MTTQDQLPIDVPLPPPARSAGARRTAAQHAALAAGRHPANGLPTNTSGTCGTCVHLERNARNTKVFHKCPHHALGTSHSEASDIRTTWPACPHYSRTPQGEHQ